MEIFSTKEQGLDAILARLDRRYEPGGRLAENVGLILDSVRKGGDRALIELAARFDGCRLSPDRLKVGEVEIQEAVRSLDANFRRALRESVKNVTAFARAGKRRSWMMRNSHGAAVGERFDPIQRVGLYIPAGSAPLVSTAIMTVAVAKAAGVSGIVAVSPVKADGRMDPALLAAIHLCGATEIYRIGGVQAIAALAYGTQSIRPVDKICGPGSAWVTEAKRQVFGRVSIDLLPGPSEVAVVADAGANPAWAAADLLAQAEHGADSAALFLTTSRRMLGAVRKEISRQAAALSRGAILEESLGKNAMLIQAANVAEIILLLNAYAPEHLALHLSEPDAVAREIKTAGAIFLGGWSPVAVGDFVAGPSHTLPTGGAGKSFGGLTVEMFQRRTSLIRYDRRSLARADAAIQSFSRVEGLDAHGRSSAIRFEA